MAERKRSTGSDYIFREPNYAFQLGELTGQVKALAEAVAASNTRNEKNDKALDSRVEKLEKGRWILTGAGTVAGAVVSSVIQWVIYSGVIKP